MPRNPTDYDQALICENGHVATSMLQRAPEHDAPFCDKCGAPTLRQCKHCENPIRGYYFSGAVGAPYRRPAYCIQCGKPFPWTEASLEVGRELLDELEGLGQYGARAAQEGIREDQFGIS